nr:Zgc:101716 [Danio rerio]
MSVWKSTVTRVFMMEILGSTFDDSVFEESRDRRVSAALPTYQPKICEPLWFCEDGNEEDSLEEQKTLKFRGDLAYRRKQYQIALDDYASCLSLVPAGNTSVKRDVLEGIARCCCHLGKKDEALNACEKLRTDVSNTCHLTCVLQLELSVHEHYRDLTSSISSLQQLCCLHPYHPWHWLNLATSFQRLLESDNHPETSSAEEKPEKQQETKNILRLKTIMGLIRARMLIEILRVQQFSFVLENSLRALQDIEEALHVLQPTEKILQMVSEVMAEDLNPEKMREETQDGESLSGLCVKDFDERWWNKLHSKLQEDTTALPFHTNLQEIYQ